MKRLVADGKATKSVQRYRSMLGSFFTWAVERRTLPDSPLRGLKVPSGGRPPEEMAPWTSAELAKRFAVWHALHPDMAEVARFLGLTGSRWSEARDLTIADVFATPFPSVRIRHSRPEGSESKTTKNGDPRTVPLADKVLPYIQARMVGRAGDARTGATGDPGRATAGDLIRRALEQTGHRRQSLGAVFSCSIKMCLITRKYDFLSLE